MTYVDGFLVPVPTANKDQYRAFAEKWTDYFKSLGAVSFAECWGDDVPAGEMTDFARSVQLKPDETVVFSWMVWPDKETRNIAWAKMMEEAPDEEMPFDGKRMVYGGFTPMVMVN